MFSSYLMVPNGAKQVEILVPIEFLGALAVNLFPSH